MRPPSSSRSPAPRQRVTPVQERSRRRIDAILDATAGLLAAQGAEGVTILAIAEAAGVPPATVYHYFENRLAVFAALARRTMAGVDAMLTRRLAEFAEQEAFASLALLEALHGAYRDAPGYVSVLRTLRAEPALQEVVRESNLRMAEAIAAALVQRTPLPAARARRVGWILSEACEQVVEAALMAEAREARALIAEMAEMVDVLLAHYAAPAAPAAPVGAVSRRR